jgi:hypothetical protein
VGVKDGVAVGGCGVLVAVGDLRVGVQVGHGVRVRVGHGLRVSVGVGVAVSVSVGVGVSVSVGVGVSVSVGVGVSVSVEVAVSVAVSVSPAVIAPKESGSCASTIPITCGDGLGVDFGRLNPAFCAEAPTASSVFNFTM